MGEELVLWQNRSDVTTLAEVKAQKRTMTEEGGGEIRKKGAGSLQRERLSRETWHCSERSMRTENTKKEKERKKSRFGLAL
ncbi:hypothetical protein GBF38_020843 [Nibea albiflora]|uniref:Uncharacterized protein n=1 Tax=Nibea albiflora TaxID=240163 RepID=A0ACB7FF47_NIBAL|nr:hypothetical protein GBF38_020843 [Nibea albiflora]